jgi:hypothetical protein
MDWDHVAEVAAGSAPGILAVIAFFFRLDRKLHTWMIEHEMLVTWFCKEHKMEKHELPTRSRGVV